MRPSIHQYLFEKVLGAGAMGKVGLYWDDRLGRHVAIKVISPEVEGDPEAIEIYRKYFRREGPTTARFNSEFIVSIYDSIAIGEDLCLVMEYVDGRDLEKILKRDGRPPVPYDVALTILRDIAAGLSHAHEVHVVHRDLKPGNVMITRRGLTKIADFGLGLRLDANTSTVIEGRARHFVGTKAYASPEQLRCEPMSCASDVFSFGIVAYELLSQGMRPFGGRPFTERGTPEPPIRSLVPELPAEAADLVHAALNKSPEDRPDAATLQAGLDALLSGHGLQASRNHLRKWAEPAMPEPIPDLDGEALARLRETVVQLHPHDGSSTELQPAKTESAHERPWGRSDGSSGGARIRLLLWAATGALALLLVAITVLVIFGKKASLTVEVEPSSARLLIDGRPHPVGFRIDGLEPGTHRLRIADDSTRFVARETTAELRAGVPAVITIALASAVPDSVRAYEEFQSIDRIDDPRQRLPLYDQFLAKWPHDSLVPEVMYRKGLAAFYAKDYVLAKSVLIELRDRWPGARTAEPAKLLLNMPELRNVH